MERNLEGDRSNKSQDTSSNIEQDEDNLPAWLILKDTFVSLLLVLGAALVEFAKHKVFGDNALTTLNFILFISEICMCGLAILNLLSVAKRIVLND